MCIVAKVSCSFETLNLDIQNGHPFIKLKWEWRYLSSKFYFIWLSNMHSSSYGLLDASFIIVGFCLLFFFNALNLAVCDVQKSYCLKEPLNIQCGSWQILFHLMTMEIQWKQHLERTLMSITFTFALRLVKSTSFFVSLCPVPKTSRFACLKNMQLAICQ